jgi:acetyl esterase
VIPGPGGGIPIRIFTPEGDGRLPILMNFHGGGWVLGSVEATDEVSRYLANGAGCIVISVEYRLAPESKFPAAADDCFAATVWASENAASFGGDADRLAVTGGSAGGNLATVVALADRPATYSKNRRKRPPSAKRMRGSSSTL